MTTRASRLPEAALAVLSSRFAEAIGNRRVRTAVFTTYTFDPGFFELQVLPLLFQHQSFSQVDDKVRLQQLEDALRGVDHLSVYYDRRALSQDAEPARLDYRRIDVRRRTGAFHPKLAFLLVDKRDEDETVHHQSLLVACLSANLTRAGWWENVECGHIEEIRHRGRVPYRRDLLAIVRRIRASAADDDHPALDAVHAFLRDRVSTETPANPSAGRHWHTRFFGGARLDLADWLAELGLGGRNWNLEVISPYFDAGGAAPLKRLIEEIGPRAARVYLPCDADGSGRVTETAYRAVAALRGVQWARLPDAMTRRSAGAAGERLAPRSVHAKVYRFWRRGGGDVALVGSVNCTSAAHGHAGSGNLEAAFLSDLADLRLPARWWLEPLDHDVERFVEEAPDEADGLDHPPFGVSIRYDWGSDALAVRLEGQTMLPIEVADVSGLRLFTIDRAGDGQWLPCEPGAAEAVRKRLPSSSFLMVRGANSAWWRVLVREEGMAHRPSVWSDLSPDKILECWSLLSPEERGAFPERHMASGEKVEGLAVADRARRPAGDTLFDGFAGVFHAFGSLRRDAENAIEQKRYGEAEARLLGAKYDSLRELLRKTLERRDGDAVLAYVTFLSARQLRATLTGRCPEFFRERGPLVEKLDRLISDGVAQYSRTLASDDARVRKFLDWFEPVFLQDLRSE